MFDTPGPRLFALPPGVDFPPALVAGLRARLAGQPPEAMARVTLSSTPGGCCAAVQDVFTAPGRRVPAAASAGDRSGASRAGGLARRRARRCGAGWN